MSTFKLYTDASLSTEFNPATDRIGPVSDNVANDFVLYLGSTVTGRRARRNSDPGVDPIQVTVTDTDPGNNLEAADVKLAETNVDLDSAVGGDPLNYGVTEVLGGVGNQLEIHIRVQYLGGIATDETVGIEVTQLQEDEP